MKTGTRVRVLSLATAAGLLLFSSPALATTPAADADLNGDGYADLVTVGGEHGIASGLWLVPGAGDGSAGSATNIGFHGNGVFQPGQVGDPDEFDGAQVITGAFSGNGVQQYLVYYPTGRNAGGAVILKGNGDGAPIPTEFGQNYSAINGGTFSTIDWNDWQTIDSPIQLANAGSHHSSYPDLVGIAGKGDGSTFLASYPNVGGPGGYVDVYPLTVATPTGGADWNTWTITTAQTTSGTALFLHQASTGTLYLWNDFVASDAGTATYTAYRLSSNFHTGDDVTLRAADIDGDGTGDLWAVGDGAAATAWLVGGLDSATATGTVTAQPAQGLPAA
ncbi:hypothetical protein [Actinoplanes sp. NPDC020271]|uniref:hypothetical protein n=1 Tax=Actinoplanes sp. NPDC020271 TaxID=3363896 RepID=UPI0037A6FF96